MDLNTTKFVKILKTYDWDPIKGQPAAQKNGIKRFNFRNIGKVYYTVGGTTIEKAANIPVICINEHLLATVTNHSTG